MVRVVLYDTEFNIFRQMILPSAPLLIRVPVSPSIEKMFNGTPDGPIPIREREFQRSSSVWIAEGNFEEVWYEERVIAGVL